MQPYYMAYFTTPALDSSPEVETIRIKPSEADHHPATLRGQQKYDEFLPTSMCVRVAHLSDGGDNCATVIGNEAGGNCVHAALLNGVRLSTQQVGEIVCKRVFWVWKVDLVTSASLLRQILFLQEHQAKG